MLCLSQSLAQAKNANAASGRSKLIRNRANAAIISVRSVTNRSSRRRLISRDVTSASGRAHATWRQRGHRYLYSSGGDPTSDELATNPGTRAVSGARNRPTRRGETSTGTGTRASSSQRQQYFGTPPRHPHRHKAPGCVSIRSQARLKPACAKGQCHVDVCHAKNRDLLQARAGRLRLGPAALPTSPS